MMVRRIVTVGAAALAACGVLGMAPAGQAGSASVATWTRLAPATHPSGRINAAMAYDAATGNVVLFGGTSLPHGNHNDTWTWNGTTWTRQHPVASPGGGVMAYDAATGTVVLFSDFFGGGSGTWTWDGTTWTQRRHAAIPPTRGAPMAYDPATGTVVMFGGNSEGGPLNETWTWDGTTWTQQHPATSPPALVGASMAYDAATGTVVLFGGSGPSGATNDTWTWDGTTWTQQHPATSPPVRFAASMAYDAATGTVVLFGGLYAHRHVARDLADTWTWDGTTWTRQAPATHPSTRDGAAMAYDAATGNVVLFGGASGTSYLGDTWTWG